MQQCAGNNQAPALLFGSTIAGTVAQQQQCSVYNVCNYNMVQHRYTNNQQQQQEDNHVSQLVAIHTTTKHTLTPAIS
jgi:hypothetical protein